MGPSGLPSTFSHPPPFPLCLDLFLMGECGSDIIGRWMRARLQSRAQPHPILYFLTISAHLSAKKFSRRNFFLTTSPPPPPPPRRQTKFWTGYHFRGQKFDPHLYFVLFCAPGSHFTHPHLFHLSFPHPRSRRKVPYSAVWDEGRKCSIP